MRCRPRPHPSCRRCGGSAACSASKSLPKPQPKAVIMARDLLRWLRALAPVDVFSTLRILPRRGRMAWKCRSRPSLALPPALSPSTRKISHLLGSRSEQSASLPGRDADSRTRLAPGQLPGLAGGLPGALGAEAPVQDGPGHGGVLLQVGGELLAHQAVHNAAHLAAAQLGLGLALKLGVLHFDGDDGREAFPDVLALEVLRRCP